MSEVGFRNQNPILGVVRDSRYNTVYKTARNIFIKS
jgi:hypothetical protein